MARTLQVTFRNMAATPALESRARSLSATLGPVCADIERCHVVIEAPAARQAPPGPFRVRLEITVPRRESLAGRTHILHHAHADPYLALREVFHAARRQLEALERPPAATGHGRGVKPVRVLY